MTDSLPGGPARRWTGPLVTLAVVLVGLVTVFALGGFERRSAPTQTVEPGTPIDAGNLVFRLDTATVQYFAKTAGGPWQVVVSGAVRNRHEESLAPLSGAYGNLVGIDRASQQFIDDPRYALGRDAADAPWANRRQVVPPVDQWMELRATFRFDSSFAPTDSFEVGVVPMEFTANAVLGLNDVPTWNPDSFQQSSTVSVALTRLPDTDY